MFSCVQDIYVEVMASDDGDTLTRHKWGRSWNFFRGVAVGPNLTGNNIRADVAPCSAWGLQPRLVNN